MMLVINLMVLTTMLKIGWMWVKIKAIVGFVEPFYITLSSSPYSSSSSFKSFVPNLTKWKNSAYKVELFMDKDDLMAEFATRPSLSSVPTKEEDKARALFEVV